MSSLTITPTLEPITQAFMDSLAGAPPLYTLEPSVAHQLLTDLQSRPVPLLPVDITDTTWPAVQAAARAATEAIGLPPSVVADAIAYAIAPPDAVDVGEIVLRATAQG